MLATDYLAQILDGLGSIHKTLTLRFMRLGFIVCSRFERARRRLFNMLTDSRILKGVLLIMRHLGQNQYANQPSHKHS